MKYATFLVSDNKWMLFEGVGLEGKLLGEITEPPGPIDFSLTLSSALWVCHIPGDGKNSVLRRLKLPELSVEHSFEVEKRLVAIAAAPDGRKIVALEIPQIPGQLPSLVLRDGHGWSTLSNEAVPDVSSRPVWIDERRIAFETAGRDLAICDPETGKITSGRPGRCPAAASLINRWYAVQEGQVKEFVAVAVGDGKEPGASVSGFDFGEVTSLRTTLDGEVFTWTEPKVGLGNEWYIQQRDQKRIRCDIKAHEVCAVLGPLDFTNLSGHSE
jgi:hypothetical protein